MARYSGANLTAFAKAIKNDLPTGKDKQRDWSIDIAYHLAMTLLALEQLEKLEVKTVFNQRRMIAPHLENAWRQLIYLRQKRLPVKIMLYDVPRRVTLAQYTDKIMLENNIGHGKQKTYFRTHKFPRYKHKYYRKLLRKHNNAGTD